MKVQWSEIDQFLKQADSVLIASHVEPDGDALGSTLAMAHVCKQFGKRVICVNESPIPKRFSFLPGIEEILQPNQMEERFQHVIVVDAADRSRVGKTVLQLFHPHVALLNIDHHKTNDAFGTVNVIDPNACATAEVLYHWMKNSDQVKWDSTLSTYLYTGILTDTGGFRYSNTSAKVFRMAAQLVEYGASADEIADQALEASTYEQIRCLKQALSTLAISNDGQMAWLSLSHEDMKTIQATDGDVEGIVDIPRRIVGVDVGIFFREAAKNTIRVSFRSKKKVDVSKIAQSFGGGGHPRAAGCTIEGELEKVKKQVLKRVEAELEWS